MGGIILMGLGLYFIFIRPAFLPEDPRYMGTTLQAIQTTLPGLPAWLKRVFWVMGGYMFAAGLLTCHLAQTSFRTKQPGAAGVAGMTGLASIGLMAAVNFIIGSDFRWMIFSFCLPWVLALTLFWFETHNVGLHTRLRS